MKKVFVMPSLIIDGERIDKVGHINGLSFPSPEVFLDGVELSSDNFKLKAASFAIELETAVELPSPVEDIWKTLYDERKMDITIKDDRGREFYIPNARITNRFKITGRIPRRMKKHLKRIHGVDWKQYHPNAEMK